MLIIELFEDIPNSLYQYSKLGKDLNKVFRNMSLKSVVEKSFFDNKINNEARNRLEHNNQIINIYVENPINQNIICSYQLENQSDVKKYDFRNTVRPKKENILNQIKKNIPTNTIMNNNESKVKRDDVPNEKTVFPSINKNKESLHNRYKSHHLVSSKKSMIEGVKEAEDLNVDEKLMNKKLKQEEKIDKLAFKYNPKYDSIYKRPPNAFVNRVKRTENLFSIDHSNDEIPLNHSIELESSFTIRKQNQIFIKSIKKNNSSKNQKQSPSVKKIKNSLYLTDVGSLDSGNMNQRLRDILSNKSNKNKMPLSKNKPSLRANSSPSSDSRSINKRDENNKSRKSSQEKRPKKIKLVPFNSATLRDCGEKFILNDNPGVGMYNPAESPYYVKKEFNSNITKNFEKQKMRKIWTDRFLSRGYKHVNFN